MIDYKLLEAFAAVIHEGGFDRASQKLHITQSAVSQRVKLLEEQVGNILLSRSVPPKVTPIGKQYLKHFQQVEMLEKGLVNENPDEKKWPFHSISIGINADSLSTWFIDAISDFVKKENLLLDLKVDDQDETHKMLRDGLVAGCISSRKRAIQGCRSELIGKMEYVLIATPWFKERYFPKGLSLDCIESAPCVIFNRKDQLQFKLFNTLFGADIPKLPASYIPSSMEFVEFILKGNGYGMGPTYQCIDLIRAGKLIDLAPDHHMMVFLYWHCWRMNSRILSHLTTCLKKSFPEE